MRKTGFIIFKKVKSVVKGRGFEKVPGMVFLYNLMFSLVTPKKPVLLNDCQGSRMYVDPRDQAISRFLMLDGVYEPEETKMFKDTIKPGMVVLDIGANIGYYTLIASKLVGDTGKVYAFEPVPRNYQFLKKNVQINNYTNVVTIPKALSNKKGKQKIFVNSRQFGSCSLFEGCVACDYSVTIETLTMDEFFKTHNKKIDLIKMDVEGAEGLILEGSKEILEANNITIFMEFCPRMLKGCKTDPLKLLYELKKQGFNIYRVDENIGPTQSSPEEIIEFCKKPEDNNGEDWATLFLKK